MTLEQAWKSFRRDRVEQARVQLRRYRAEQIMAEFREGRFRDLEAFEQELWKIESRTIVNGDDWTGDLYNNEAMTLEYANELSTALDEENVELHGNYIWKHGTNKFHPQGGASTKDKEKALRTIEEILTSGLDPDKKVERLREVPGIGIGVASGLAMIAHPNEVAIFNGVSKSMAAAVGRHVTNYGQYQELAIELRDRLGAKDFLELDWFLYQYNNSASGAAVGRV